MATDTQKDLRDIIWKPADEKSDHHWKLTHRGEAISPDDAILTTSATWQHLVQYTQGDANGPKDEKGNLKSRKTWYALLVLHVRFNLPGGFWDDAQEAGEIIRKGKLEISTTADVEGIGKQVDGKAVSGNWEAYAIDSGPRATSSSQNVTNSVSVDVGANIGFFSSTPTGGMNISQNFSNSISTTLKDVEIQENSRDNRRTQVWWYDFSKLNDSETAKSEFSESVQAIWQFQYSDPEQDMQLDKMRFTNTVKWTPVVQTKFGANATTDVLRADEQVYSWPVEWTHIQQTNAKWGDAPE